MYHFNWVNQQGEDEARLALSAWQIELLKMSTEMELEIVAYLKEPLVEAPSSGHQRLKEGCNVLDRQSDRQKGRKERGTEGEGELQVASCLYNLQGHGKGKSGKLATHCPTLGATLHNHSQLDRNTGRGEDGGQPEIESGSRAIQLNRSTFKNRIKAK